MFTALFICLVPAHSSFAGNSVDFNTFLPGQNTSYILLEDAFMRDRPFGTARTVNRVYFHGNYGYTHRPWVLRSQTNPSQRATALVNSDHVLDLGAAWLISDQLSLSFHVPFAYVKVSPAYGGNAGMHSDDSVVALKYRLMGSDSFAVALQPELTFPTGTKYSGDLSGGGLTDSSLGLGGKLLLESRFEDHLFVANLGFSHYGSAEIKNLGTSDYPQYNGRNRFFLGGGWMYWMAPKWCLDAEITARLVTKKSDFNPPGEALLGIRNQNTKWVSYHAAIGTGLNGVGASDLRLVAGVKFPLWLPKEKKAAEPLPRPQPKNEPVPELKPESKVKFTGTAIEVYEQIPFAVNSSELTPEGKALVDQVANEILAHKDSIGKVTVEGHTDHTGSITLNNTLSQDRANSVRQRLVESGVPRNMLEAKGFGSNVPRYDFKKAPETLWRKNRRVEFKIQPN